MKIRYILIGIGLFLLGFNPMMAQEVISLSNPSFEDTPHIGGTLNKQGPKNWFDCGFDDETPPDIQPNSDLNAEPFYGVTTKPYHGKTYLGMVTRENDSYEGVGQRLKKPLLAGTTYAFNLFLAQSPTYVSLDQTESSVVKTANYNTPIKIRIYGGNGYCETSQLLAETEPVANTKWKDYSLVFTPKSEYNFILIQAFYNTPTLFSYNGNILVDHLSDIVEVVEGPIFSRDKVLSEGDSANLEKLDKERASFKLSLKGSLSYATPTEIDSIVVDIVDRLTKSGVEIPLKIGIMRQADQFDKEVKRGGLRQLVLNTPKAKLTTMIRCLETMNMTAPLNILKKTTLIFNNKENKTATDVTYFEASDELWLETTSSESIKDLRWKYFQRNKDSIIQEIVDLY